MICLIDLLLFLFDDDIGGLFIVSPMKIFEQTVELLLYSFLVLDRERRKKRKKKDKQRA